MPYSGSSDNSAEASDDHMDLDALLDAVSPSSIDLDAVLDAVSPSSEKDTGRICMNIGILTPQ